MTRGFHQTQTRPSLISNFPRQFTAQEISGAPLSTLEAFFKEGDMEHVFIPSCIPRDCRLKQGCVSLKYFSASIPATQPEATLVIAYGPCDNIIANSFGVDIKPVMVNTGFVLNCYCFDIDQNFDRCDQFTVNILFPGASKPQSLLTRVVLDWELR